MSPVKQKQSVIFKFIKENFKTTILPSILTVIAAILLIVVTEPYTVPFFKDVIKQNEIEATVSKDAENHLSKYYDMAVKNKPSDLYDNTSKIETFVTMTLKKKYKKYNSFLDEEIVIYVKSIGQNGIRYEIPDDEDISVGQLLFNVSKTKIKLGSNDTIPKNQFTPNTFSEIEQLFTEKFKPKQ